MDLNDKPQTSWSAFDDVCEVPLRESLTIKKSVEDDEYEYKLDLAFPFYRDENLKPWVFPVVRTAEKVLANDGSLNKEYLHPFGYESFNQASIRLLLGEECKARIENRTICIQTISATGALRIGAEFLRDVLGKTTFYGPEQRVEHTVEIFLKAGFTDYEVYRYLNTTTLRLDMEGLLQDLGQAKEGSVVLLQPSAHNPTGCDPTQEEWEKIADVMEARRLFPFFTSAFQGFASGDLDQDVWPIRYFASRNIELFCAQSYSKNFSLYNERVGNLLVILNNPKKRNPVRTHLFYIAKGMYANPPSHGARIVAFILGDKSLFDQWKETIFNIADRLKRMRCYLREELERLGAAGTWNHITNQVGNFCFTGLNDIQVEHMKKHHHIYLRTSGRLTMSGLNLDNVEYVAKAINDTLHAIPLEIKESSDFTSNFK